MSNQQSNNNNTSSVVKGLPCRIPSMYNHPLIRSVKVFYSLRSSKSTRLTTFNINTHSQEESLKDLRVPLKTCLWSICSSSPDIICRDHDLSIYTANFHESGHTTGLQRDTLVWEGHGLLSWIMDQTKDELYIQGKSSLNNKQDETNSDSHIDIYIELQPTMKWIKDDFFSAIRNQTFEQFRSSALTPMHPICNCYSASDDTRAIAASAPVNRDKGANNNNNNNNKSETEYDRYLRQRAQESSPPLPSRLPSLSSVPVFRPEPIFPPSNSPPTNNSSSNNSKRSRLSSPTTTTSNNNTTSSNVYYKQADDPFNKKTEINRRSAFTIASIADSNNNKGVYLPSTSTSSTGSSVSPPPTHIHNSHDNLIPVIYTPSNKKRKKNLPIMPVAAEGSNSNGRGEENPIYSHHHQQVNTVVRTYYEVDRDDHGNYILPVEIDSWTVVDLGTVIFDRPAYHNQRYIYPANYTVRKWYRSMVDPKSDTQYTCRILENGREPKFEVTADDCPMTYSGPTPTTVWTIIVRRAFAIRNQEYGHNPVGPDFFGLRKNTIAKMIQDLPNASKCSQYVWQTFEPARFNKPGRNRRRADSTLPGSLLGGVNYGLTSSRLIHNTNLRPTQHSYRGTNTITPNSPQQQQQQQQQRPYDNYKDGTTLKSTEKDNGESTKSPCLSNSSRPTIETA